MPRTQSSDPPGLVGLDAVIFDLDGVVTQTARVHAAAWKEMFDGFLRARGGDGDVDLFDQIDEYRRYVDGKPRYDGVRSFLAARGLALPYGDPSDPPKRETICGLGNRKNRIFLKRLERDGVDVYGSTVRVIGELRRRGVKIGVVSASKNCSQVLAGAGLASLFDAQVDGIEAARLGLQGKPAPDTFLEAARRLSASPERAAVVEDAVAGVEAGHRGGFGLVIGVDRAGQATALREHGADLVVQDMDEVPLEHTAVRADAVELPSALDERQRLLERIRGQAVAMFLDYDGTLTPIVRRPEDALLSDRMRESVRRLATRCPVVIVSGRDRVTVEQLVEIDGIGYVGSHGFDIVGPRESGIRREVGIEFLATLDEAEADLAARLKDVAGALVERKKFTIATHYRLVAASQRARVETAVDAVRHAHPSLRKDRGKAVFELRPDLKWDKGAAVVWLLEQLGLKRVVGIHIGDDVTDETLFEALAGRGFGIIVATDHRPTSAQFRLRDPDEVRQFLEWLAATLAGEGR